jgi:hypothetical protein
VLRIIFGPKRDEVTGGWRKLYNEELHNLYSSLVHFRSRCISVGRSAMALSSQRVSGKSVNRSGDRNLSSEQTNMRVPTRRHVIAISCLLSSFIKFRVSAIFISLDSDGCSLIDQYRAACSEEDARHKMLDHLSDCPISVSLDSVSLGLSLLDTQLSAGKHLAFPSVLILSVFNPLKHETAREQKRKLRESSETHYIYRGGK